MLDEEQILKLEYKIDNMDPLILEKVAFEKKNGLRLDTIEDMKVTIQGEPYYQPYKNFDLWLKFNN